MQHLAATIQRDLLVKLAARHRLPAVYPYRFFVDVGGLMSRPSALAYPRHHQGRGHLDNRSDLLSE